MQPLLPRTVAAFLGILPLVCAGSLARGQEKVLTSPSEEAEIVHVLNRITFGPRPGDVEAVEKMGLQNFIRQQLHPETIDDSAVESELQQFDILQLSTEQLTAIYKDERKKFIEKAREQAAAESKAGTPGAPPTTEGGQPNMQGPPVMQTDAPPQGDPVMQGTSNMQEDSETGHLFRKYSGQNGKTYHSPAAIGELEKAKLVRAVDSHRQLQEVLVDFWTNHFNIDVKKGLCRVMKVADDRDVIRPHIWGRFRDLLEASAKSPAMLFYLDNAENSVPKEVSPFAQEMIANYMQKNFGVPNTAPPPTKAKKLGGINENYAREIMELHTMGVDGGYTQKDVQEVARCFTGWTIDRQTGGFTFRERDHDNGAKLVLGHAIPAGGGMQDGETVLDILCAQPSTAHFISRELCQRFVSDDPPESLVTRVAGVFRQTDGDLRQVVTAILTSPEFLSPASFQTKIKSPLEFAVSAVRATDSTLIAQLPPPFGQFIPSLEGIAVMGKGKASDKLSEAKRQTLNWHIYELGEPLFACTPPTGYKEVSKNWVSPGALIERLNFAMALTDQRVGDVQFDPEKVLGGMDLDKPDGVLDQCVSTLLQGNISSGTRHVLAQAALPAPGTSQTVNPTKLIALILGSPEFQRK